jgi:uncharacterized phage protein (TIGR01671 family)
MKRIFRGKRINNGEWVYGYLFLTSFNSATRIGLTHCIQVINDDGVSYKTFEVNPDTVGQFTGLKDKKGVDVYEWDVVRLNTKDNVFISITLSNQAGKAIKPPKTMNSVVEFENGSFGFLWMYGYEGLEISFEKTEVIGNKFDNPELINN